MSYFLEDVPVCRGFYMRCLDLSKVMTDSISARVRDKQPRPRFSATSPYRMTPTQFETCKGYWQSFFGEQCQSSGDGHRYFPANLPSRYIYNNLFWRWWQLHRETWFKAPETVQDGHSEILEEWLQSDHLERHQSLNDDSIVTPTAAEVYDKFAQFFLESDEKLMEGSVSEQEPEVSQDPEDSDSSVMGEDVLQDDESMKEREKIRKEAGFPSFSTFLRARKDPQFADVKNREKDIHARCPTCSELRTKIVNAFNNPSLRFDYDNLLNTHLEDAKGWRDLEQSLRLQAISNPEKLTVLSYDDTESFGFPRMTRRPIKNFPTDRVELIPFNLTNHGTRENVYIYHFKHKWSKGADRLCTILYTVISRIKRKTFALTKTEKAQKFNRHLVLIADNYSENKNNVLFAFLSDLVLHGWYDDIQLLYGPVGHTHNGNDAAHSVHNQIAGNYPSVTPAELFNAYSYAWASERTRPQPIIMECQFAWHERFSQPTSGHQPISGFTITQNNPYNVRAFRFKAVQQSSTRKCELQIKGSPLEEKWRGENSVLGGEGFFILNHLLEGFPKLKKPHAYEMPKAYLNGIKSAKFRSYCESIGRSMMHEHLVTMAETLIIPSLGPVTSEELSDLAPSRQKSLSGYGPVEWIGVRRKSGLLSHLVPFMRDQMFDETTFWDVGAGPVHPELFLDPVSIPIVRYSTRVHHEKHQEKSAKRFPEFVRTYCWRRRTINN